MACHKLTLVNTEAGRHEVKKRKYANQHEILAESVRKYSTEDDVLKYLRKMANLFQILSLLVFRPYICYPF